MHMTSQKGAPACWGSNEALPRAPSPSSTASGPTPACHTAGLARARALTEGRAPTRSASTTHARSATSLDPQHGVVVHYGDVRSMHKVYCKIYQKVTDFCEPSE